jgi:hypothetical protein
LRLRDASQLDQRLTASLFLGHSRAHIVRDVHLKMAFEFLAQFPIARDGLEYGR